MSARLQREEGGGSQFQERQGIASLREQEVYSRRVCAVQCLSAAAPLPTCGVRTHAGLSDPPPCSSPIVVPQGFVSSEHDVLPAVVLCRRPPPPACIPPRRPGDLSRRTSKFSSREWKRLPKLLKERETLTLFDWSGTLGMELLLQGEKVRLDRGWEGAYLVVVPT